MKIHASIGTFRQLEILLAVYDSGTVKQAAEYLHLTQPTISIQLKKLSDAVGMPLYEQVGKKLLFTEAGEKVASAARDILQRTDMLDMELSDLRGLKTGTLKLAVVTTSKYFIPHLLGPFCKRYPNVEIEFNVGNRQQILQKLDKGHDDFYVFSNLPERDDIITIDFLDNPLVAIAPEDHPLAGKRSIDLARFAQEPFLIREKGSGTRFATEHYLKTRKTSLNVRMTIESNEAIKHSVMSGLGVSILSKHTLTFGESKGLEVLDIKQFPIPSQWFLVRRKAKYFSPIAKTFLQFIESEGREALMQELRK
ncbi:DNA-binding transcriptional regulator, LysR family [Alteromonadaceae bacterium Bs31]|nr:DNA-binding transcriptional regulator, LysR family [Alteromonadaceae bacterium Bs31]